MSNTATPDSWETQADLSPSNENSNDPTAKFSTLNVNAAEFVPSFSFSSPNEGESKVENDQESPVDGTSPAQEMSGKFSHKCMLIFHHL